MIERPSLIRPLADVERDAILLALYRTKGNITVAARKLQIALRTLRNKLDDYRRQKEFVVPCQCQWGYPKSNCTNHIVDLAPHPEEISS